MGSELIKKLESIVGKEYISTSSVDRRVYSNVVGLAGELGKMADVIVLPQSAEQVQKIVLLANETKTPIIPRGAGTNVTIAKKGGILLDLALMDKHLEIDDDNMVVVADAGYPVYKVMRELDKKGLRFPFSPLYTSAPQIGSAVACNNTGHYMTRFGCMGDNLVGLEVVMPTGEIVTFGSGAYKNGYGFYYRYVGLPDLIGLFVNAAGTTGVITKVAVRVKPKPEAEDVLAYGWRRDQAEELTQTMYLLQRNFIYDILLINYWNYHSAIEMGKLQLPPDVHFVALLSIDARSQEELSFERKRVMQVCHDHNGLDLGELGRYTMGPPHYRLWLSVSPWMQRIQGTYFYNPIKKFPEVYDVFEAVTKKYDFWSGTYCPAWFSFHGRNTMNPYPMLAITNPTDSEELERIKRWWNEINTKLVQMGCTQYTITDILPRQNYESLGPLWELNRRIKRFLDPNGIMNPSEMYEGLDQNKKTKGAKK